MTTRRSFLKHATAGGIITSLMPLTAANGMTTPTPGVSRVKYLCNGAVSGNWWRSPMALDEFPPVYSIIDLYSDGTSKTGTVYYQFDA